MPILNIQLSSTGLAGVKPQWDYIQTNDTVAEVLTVGYLNHSVDHGYSFNQGDLVAVGTLPLKQLPLLAYKPLIWPSSKWLTMEHQT